MTCLQLIGWQYGTRRRFSYLNMYALTKDFLWSWPFSVISVSPVWPLPSHSWVFFMLPEAKTDNSDKSCQQNPKRFHIQSVFSGIMTSYKAFCLPQLYNTMQQGREREGERAGKAEALERSTSSSASVVYTLVTWITNLSVLPIHCFSFFITFYLHPANKMFALPWLSLLRMDLIAEVPPHKVFCWHGQLLRLPVSLSAVHWVCACPLLWDQATL